jgi:hypothetical protein
MLGFDHIPTGKPTTMKDFYIKRFVVWGFSGDKAVPDLSRLEFLAGGCNGFFLKGPGKV